MWPWIEIQFSICNMHRIPTCTGVVYALLSHWQDFLSYAYTYRYILYIHICSYAMFYTDINKYVCICVLRPIYIYVYLNTYVLLSIYIIIERKSCLKFISGPVNYKLMTLGYFLNLLSLISPLLNNEEIICGPIGQVLDITLGFLETQAGMDYHNRP